LSNAPEPAELPDLHFPDIRHTVASQFSTAPSDHYILKEILGHKATAMAARYAHVSPTYFIKSIDRMNTLWAGVKPQASTPGILPEDSSVTAASQTAYEDTPVPAQSGNDAGLAI